jgi:hypothetical protein
MRPQLLTKILQLIAETGIHAPTGQHFNEYGCRFTEYQLPGCRLDSTFDGGIGCFDLVVDGIALEWFGADDGAREIVAALNANKERVKSAALASFLGGTK